MTTTLADIFLSDRKSIMWSMLRIVRDSQTAEDVAQETWPAPAEAEAEAEAEERYYAMLDAPAIAA